MGRLLSRKVRQDLRRGERKAQEVRGSTTATVPTLIGFDLGLMLGFEIRERIPREIL
jgi:hypothetical protein